MTHRVICLNSFGRVIGVTSEMPKRDAEECAHRNNIASQREKSTWHYIAMLSSDALDIQRKFQERKGTNNANR